MVYAIKKIKIYGIKIWTDKAKKLSITPLIRLLCESTWIPKYLLTDFYWSVDKFQNKLSKVQTSNILVFSFLPLYKLQMKTSRLVFFFFYSRILYSTRNHLYITILSRFLYVLSPDWKIISYLKMKAYFSIFYSVQHHLFLYFNTTEEIKL